MLESGTGSDLSSSDGACLLAFNSPCLLVGNSTMRAKVSQVEDEGFASASSAGGGGKELSGVVVLAALVCVRSLIIRLRAVV